jgi:hypothetical protein
MPAFVAKACGQLWKAALSNENVIFSRISNALSGCTFLTFFRTFLWMSFILSLNSSWVTPPAVLPLPLRCKRQADHLTSKQLQEKGKKHIAKPTFALIGTGVQVFRPLY